MHGVHNRASASKAHCLQAFTKQAEEAGLAAGYQVAQDRQQMKQLWGLRTGISVALRNAGELFACRGAYVVVAFGGQALAGSM